jgi:hypothetical protein
MQKYYSRIFHIEELTIKIKIHIIRSIPRNSHEIMLIYQTKNDEKLEQLI